MSLAPSPKRTLERMQCNITNGKTEDPQSCNATEESEKDGYEPLHAFKKIRSSSGASGLRKSPNKWTKEENQKLAALVHHYGEKKWKRISAEMGGLKTGAQCAQHWKRVLSPEIRKGHWDEHEEDLLLRLVVQYGSCWKKIAKKIPQRTDIQCRYQYLKAKQSRTVEWESKEDEALIKKVLEMACFYPSPQPPGPVHSFTNGKSHAPTHPCGCDPMNPCSTHSPQSSSTPSPTLTPSPPHHPPHHIPPTATFSPDANNHRHSHDNCGSFLHSPNHPRGNPQYREDEEDKENRGIRLHGKSAHGDKSNGSEDSRGMLRCSNGGDSSGSEGASSGSSDCDPHESSGGDGDSRPSEIEKRPIPIPIPIPWSDSSIPPPSLPLLHSSSHPLPLGSALHLNKVIWLEVAEHMARMKLTSTLRTALECKTRFMELQGNSIPHNYGGGGDSHDASSNMIYNGLKTNGAFNPPPPSSSSAPPAASSDRGTFPFTDTNINININNDRNNNNITITNNYSHNITINITNNNPHHNAATFDKKNTNGGVLGGEASTIPRPHESRSNPTTSNHTPNPNHNNHNPHNTLPPFHGTAYKGGMLPVKSEHPPLSDSPKKSGLTLPSFPSFPSFPAFPHFPPPVAQAKPARPMMTGMPLGPLTMLSGLGGGGGGGVGGGASSLLGGLDSLAAVASTLPRELLPPIDHSLTSLSSLSSAASHF